MAAIAVLVTQRPGPLLADSVKVEFILATVLSIDCFLGHTYKNVVFKPVVFRVKSVSIRYHVIAVASDVANCLQQLSWIGVKLKSFHVSLTFCPLNLLIHI